MPIARILLFCGLAHFAADPKYSDRDLIYDEAMVPF